MQPDEQEKLKKFVGTLLFLLDRSKTAYTDYLNAGKTFFYARLLRQYNDRIRELLLENSYLLPADLHPDAIALLQHYDVWTLCWDDLHKSLRPDVNDEFVFANSVTFPRASAGRIGEILQRLK